MNPVEGLILAHQPVNGATWLGARLTHLLRIVVYVVAGVNGLPALIGVFLSHKDEFLCLAYFPIHFLIALGVGLVVALLCCSLFGWLVRFVPVRRLRAAAVVVQVIPMSLPLAFNFLGDSREEFASRAASIAVSEEWQSVGDAVPESRPALLGVLGLAVTIAAVVFGLQALSRDHLIHASNLMHSGAGVRPHLVGVTVLYACLFLGYGNDYKGIWSFLIVPDASFVPFVKGVYAGLWLMLIIVPNVFWLLVLTWSWGVSDAVLLIAYSTVVGFLYLGVGLKLIDDVPFGKQTRPARNVVTLGMTLGYLVVLGIAIGIQYLLFRSVVAVIVVTSVVGLGAHLLTREALADFESRFRLTLKPGTTGSIFR